VIGAISEDYRDQPSLDDLSRVAGLDPTGLQKLFTRWAGLSPKAFLQAVTLDHAKRLLDSGMPLLETSHELGLSGPSRLHDLFITHEAMSPGDYKTGGKGLVIRYGFHAGPFGRALAMAPDGGLYMPESWPQLSAGEIAALAGLSYSETAVRVMSPFVGDPLSQDDLRGLWQQGHGPLAHPAGGDPDKVRALVLSNTTSAYPEAGRAAIGQRIATVESHGLSAISTGTMARFFSEEFRQTQAAAVARHQRLLEATDPEGYISCAVAICEIDTTTQLNQIRVPTLVIAGDQDESTPLDMAQALARGIPRAQLVTLSGCAHLSAAENPSAFSDVVGEFVASL